MSDGIFPGVPRIESPIFSSDPLSDLKEEEKALARDLNTQGFAVIEFPDPELENRIDRIKANLGPRFDIPFGDPTADKTKGGRRIQDAWKFDSDVQAIASNSKVLELLSKLYGRQAFPFQTLNFPVSTQQDLHSDAVHFSSQPERFMCGVWLAMEDVQPGAGPLFYLNGSHRWPIVTNAMIGRRGYGSEENSAQLPFAGAWEALRKCHEAKEQQFLARKGQALIWTANLLHGGSSQTDLTLTRWSQVTHYFFENCIYYTPAYSDEVIGQLATRDLRAVHDGAQRPNKYLGNVFTPQRPDHLNTDNEKATRTSLDKLMGLLRKGLKR
ncbi:Phytanoyl-CoA dioxygenase (PhyH) [Erythrobacter litoralis]|uniref:phytanoyl-CoA dioxygenase family protein n=1 Tax=Erythrobacter litoralis TaxID=39960 RepID=UPI000863A202|nr:phytanoyl-CoA dioxygenase family protein [Erythrobacter litoralis]AOL22028.1 Phytanoyl-CoA dioxygenase (PhyH) [Erythrobacter litoralis]